ncbi:uncharacterized protein [Antedon mediterranea]|uniref:uncharacterized protein n=1 Tax=Antedon mediterranea TaxID=105859 RepID=UPI003AF5AB30
MSDSNDVTGDTGNNGEDSNTIIAIVGACSAVFLLILITAIIALTYYVCRKKRELDGMESKLGNLNDVDRIMWAEMGRKDDTVTDNPAYGKEDVEDFAPLDVTAIEKEFDDEYESEIEEVDKKPDGEEQPKSSKLSILDTKTWSGMPGQKRKKAARKQVARTISRIENDPKIKQEYEREFEEHYKTDGDFDYRLFNLNSGPNQRTVNMYEDGQLQLDEEDETLPPKHIPSAGNRLLWQKKRFKDM